MSKEVYIVEEAYCEYNDEYYQINGGVNVKNVFSEYDKALAYKKVLEEEFFSEFRLYEFEDCSYKYADLLEENGLQYDSTFKEAKSVLDEHVFNEIIDSLNIFTIRKATVL